MGDRRGEVMGRDGMGYICSREVGEVNCNCEVEDEQDLPAMVHFPPTRYSLLPAARCLSSTE